MAPVSALCLYAMSTAIPNIEIISVTLCSGLEELEPSHRHVDNKHFELPLFSALEIARGWSGPQPIPISHDRIIIARRYYIPAEGAPGPAARDRILSAVSAL